MGRFCSETTGLTQVQLKAFRLNVSAACRRMSSEQVLDLADSLHATIRRRTARGRSAIASLGKPRAVEPPSVAEVWQ